MRIAIAANPEQRAALEQKGFNDGVQPLWVYSSAELYLQTGVDALIDCLFDGEVWPTVALPILLHAPITTFKNNNSEAATIARFCAWPTFIERPIWEIAAANNKDIDWLHALMNHVGWAYCMVADEPGLIAPRVISTIINEAYIAWGEGISSKKDIDIGMKLGTNYPYGPFEWAQKIGPPHIYTLLYTLAQNDSRYQPSELLQHNI